MSMYSDSDFVKNDFGNGPAWYDQVKNDFGNGPSWYGDEDGASGGLLEMEGLSLDKASGQQAIEGIEYGAGSVAPGDDQKSIEGIEFGAGAVAPGDDQKSIEGVEFGAGSVAPDTDIKADLTGEEALAKIARELKIDTVPVAINPEADALAASVDDFII